MNRKILSFALTATLLITLFGAPFSKSYGNDNVALAEDEKAQIGVEIDFAQLLKDKAAAAMLEANPEVPPFVKSMKSMSLYVALHPIPPTPRTCILGKDLRKIEAMS